MVLGKNAQGKVGKTLTWFIGFIIISFVIVILIVTSNFLSSSKKISEGWDSIEVEKYSIGELEMQTSLIRFLNKNVEFDGGVIRVEDLIKKWVLNEGREEVGEIIKEEVEESFSGIDGCYVLVIDSNEQDAEETYEKLKGLQGAQYVTKTIEANVLRFSSLRSIGEDTRVAGAIEKQKADLLKKGIVFPLILDKGNVRIKFYQGDCL